MPLHRAPLHEKHPGSRIDAPLQILGKECRSFAVTPLGFQIRGGQDREQRGGIFQLLLQLRGDPPIATEHVVDEDLGLPELLVELDGQGLNQDRDPPSFEGRHQLVIGVTVTDEDVVFVSGDECHG